MSDLQLAFVVDAATVKERARWRKSEAKARSGAAHASAVDGVDAVISAWTA